jgi:hypothetical protein
MAKEKSLDDRIWVASQVTQEVAQSAAEALAPNP